MPAMTIKNQLSNLGLNNLLFSLMSLLLMYAPLIKADDSNTQAAEPVIRGAIYDVDANSRFLIYYGDDYYLKDSNGKMLRDSNNQWILNQATMDKLVKFNVVVLQPNQPHCTPEVVDYLQNNGVDYVLGYISIGEESSSTPIKGDGSGPLRYDRASNSLLHTYKGIASFYMDVDSQKITYNAQNQLESVLTTARKIPDGQADINPTFAGYMIHPDVAWRDYLKRMRLGKPNQHAGLDQLVLPPKENIVSMQQREANFGFDGFFLDTIDTAGPYDGLGWYPWVLSAMRDTVKFISDTYPNKIVFANRGSFYFQAGLQSPITKQYPVDYSIRPYINAFLFESYMYDSDPSIDGKQQKSEYYYDNRYNQMPKIMAEAQREDGFSVFILEYDSGRSTKVDNFVQQILNEDIGMWGASTYIADNRKLDRINTTLLPHLPHATQGLPQWSSTAYEYIGEKLPSTLLSAEGIHSVNAGEQQGQVVVHWGVAHAQAKPINYRVYWSKTPDLHTADSINVTPDNLQMSAEYAHTPSQYMPYQITLENFDTGIYYFWVKAQDALGQVDNNTKMQRFTIPSPISQLINKASSISSVPDNSRHEKWYNTLR